MVGSADKWGVRASYATGEISYDWSENFRDDGLRFDFDGLGSNRFVSAELIGYFAHSNPPDDEVSGKMGGGRHSDGSSPKVYDMGIDCRNGNTRYRTEETHPDYEEGDTGGKGVGMSSKYIGYKFVKWNKTNGVLLEIWQDTGNNESTPANAWKKLASWLVTDPKWFIPGSDHQETIRIDQVGTDDLKWKWISLREIKSNDSDTGGGGTDGGGGDNCTALNATITVNITNTPVDPLSLVYVEFKDNTKMTVRAYNDLADQQRQNLDEDVAYIPFGTMIWEDSSISIRRGAEKPTPPPFPFTGNVNDFVTFKNGTTMSIKDWNSQDDDTMFDKAEDLKYIPFHSIIFEDASIGIDRNEGDPEPPSNYTGTVASYTKSINQNLINPPTTTGTGGSTTSSGIGGTGGGGTNTGNTVVATPPNIPSTAKTQGMKDFGGPKFNNATVHLIFAGTYWTTSGGEAAGNSKVNITATCQYLMTASTYFDGLLQYGIKKPKLGQVVQNTTYSLPNSYDNDDIIDLVKDSISKGQVPNNHNREQYVYVVFTPPGKTYGSGGAGAVHAWDESVSNDLDALIAMAVVHITDEDTAETTVAFTADLAECLTAPYSVQVEMNGAPSSLKGWEANPAVISASQIDDFGPLITDVCETTDWDTSGGTVEENIWVHKYYSNQDGKCTISYPKPAWLSCPIGTIYNTRTQMCEPTGTGGGSGSSTIKPILATPKTTVMVPGNGPLWSSAIVHFIFAGSGGTDWEDVDDPSMDEIVGELEAHFESTYYDGVIQYGVKRPKLGNVVIHDTMSIPDPYYSQDIALVVNDAINKGKVPALDPNVRHAYYVITKPGIDNEFGGGGWHTYRCTNVNNPYGTATIIGSAIHRDLDAMMAAISHEVVSFITNPCYSPITGGLPKFGWHADPSKISIEWGEELPDVCQPTQSDSEATSRGYPNACEVVNDIMVGKWYSNQDGKCQASKVGGKPTWLSCPTGSTWNDTAQECISNTPIPTPEDPDDPLPPTTPPSVAKDVFGTKMIYQSKTGGSSWASTSWATNPRVLEPDGEDMRDPNDNVVCVRDVGSPVVTISNGQAIFDGRSTRVSIMKNWQNVESTVYVKTNNAVEDSIGIRMKTDHYCVECNGEVNSHDCFGGYMVDFNWTDGTSYVRKEHTHNEGYGPRVNEKPVDTPTNTWIGLKGICYTMANGNVKLEMYMDKTGGVNGGTWVKIAEGTDTGSWKGPVFGGVHKGSAIRTNSDDESGLPDASYIFKNWTVREILPTGAISGDPQTGGGSCEEEIDWDYGGEVGTIEEGVPINLIEFQHIDTVDPVTGEPLVLGWDSNFDGIIDAWDENGDGQIDAIDMNFDGIADTFDIDADGRAESFDTDLDGIIDKTGGLGIGEGAGSGTGGGGLGTGTGSGGVGGGTNSPSPTAPPAIQYVVKQIPIIYAIDVVNIDACSITLPDEETEPEEIFKVAADGNTYMETRNYRKIGLVINANDSLLQDQKIRRVDVIMKKGGKGATITGNIYCRIRTGLNDTVVEEFDTVIDSSLINGNEQTFTFEIKRPTHQMNKGETLFIEYPKGEGGVNDTIGGDPDNYIMVKVSSKDVTDSVSTVLAVHDGNSLKKFPSNDLACSIWA